MYVVMGGGGGGGTSIQYTLCSGWSSVLLLE